MKKKFLHAKIHRATVKDANLNYPGSISIPEDLMQEVGIGEYEFVHVVNINNGLRFETYVIKTEAGSKHICLNGAAARLAEVDDRIIIMAYCELEPHEIPDHKPKIIVLDEENNIINKN
jgi:aspartate 1-decarboxylase